MFLHLLIIVLMSVSLITPAFSNELSVVEKQIESKKKEQKSIEQDYKAQQKQVEAIKKQLVQLASSIAENEKSILKLEADGLALQQEQLNLTASLERDYGSIGHLILALQKINRTPPEALILKPDAPLKTAQSAMLLESILPSVKSRADKLSQDLVRLAEITERLKNDQEMLLVEKQQLDLRRSEMDKLLDDRTQLAKATQKEFESTGKELAALAKEAKSIRELMAKIEKQKADEARLAKQQKGSKRVASNVPLPGLGKGQVPSQGIIKVSFGEKNDIGADSEGISIESSSRALVVAPLGGVVRFAGPFKNYGNMIIIEHKNNYHSLLAGLDKITVSEGSSLNSGEPVGSLPSSSSRGGKPTLYYELRQKGKPVDPTSMFAKK
jgi:septal ring factor EnvC (AmiA/AmiB activator)